LTIPSSSSTGFAIDIMATSSGSAAFLGTWIAVGPRVYNGTVKARYLVLSVVYAPPGTDGGKISSSVSYATGSTTGTTTSVSHSFKTDNTLSLEGKAGVAGNGGGAGVTWDYSQAATDSSSLETKKSINKTINLSGPSADGINHDEDRIYVWFNPAIDLAVSTNAITWALNRSQSSDDIVPIPVGYLNNGKTVIPPGFLLILQHAGIKPEDYPVILAQDPLAGDESALGSSRFVEVGDPYTYAPPLAKNDPVLTTQVQLLDTSTATTGSAYEESYKVGLTLTEQASFFKILSEKLKDTASWQWTN
jgi:hypothetical protein